MKLIKMGLGILVISLVSSAGALLVSAKETRFFPSCASTYKVGTQAQFCEALGCICRAISDFSCPGLACQANNNNCQCRGGGRKACVGITGDVDKCVNPAKDGQHQIKCFKGNLRGNSGNE